MLPLLYGTDLTDPQPGRGGRLGGHASTAGGAGQMGLALSGAVTAVPRHSAAAVMRLMCAWAERPLGVVLGVAVATSPSHARLRLPASSEYST